MTSPKQLPLTPVERPRRTDTYRGIAITARDVKDPSQRGKKALELYSAKPKPPAYIICHVDDAVAIGAEVEGVPVIATGTTRGLFLLGPIDIL